jgi:hypothetical protein
MRIALFFLCLPLYAAEQTPHHHHKDLIITVHQESPEEEKAPPIPTKTCCRASDCDIRLKVAIIAASVSLLTAITSTVVAVRYRC